jgi:hypothetical protein
MKRSYVMLIIFLIIGLFLTGCAPTPSDGGVDDKIDDVDDVASDDGAVDDVDDLHGELEDEKFDLDEFDDLLEGFDEF